MTFFITNAALVIVGGMPVAAGVMGPEGAGTGADTHK